MGCDDPITALSMRGICGRGRTKRCQIQPQYVPHRYNARHSREQLPPPFELVFDMAISHSDILRDILASTTKYYSANPPSSTSDVLPLIDPSDIPSPSFTHVIARLADSLRDNEISASICQPTMKHVSQLTLGYRGSFENCCRTLLSRPHAKDDPFVLETIDNFRQTLQHRFEKYDFPTMLSKAIKAQASLHRESESSLYHRRPDARERKPFNPVRLYFWSLYLTEIYLSFVSRLLPHTLRHIYNRMHSRPPLIRKCSRKKATWTANRS